MTSTHRGSIQYLKKENIYDEERPFQLFLDEPSVTEKGRNNNLEWETHEVCIESFRNNLEYFDIDNHGFTTRQLQGFSTLRDSEKIEIGYLRAVEFLLLREIKQAKTVFIFDWRVSYVLT